MKPDSDMTSKSCTKSKNLLLIWIYFSSSSQSIKRKYGRLNEWRIFSEYSFCAANSDKFKEMGSAQVGVFMD